MIFSPLGIYFACVCLFWEVFYFFFKSMASVQFSSVQSLSCVQLFVTPWITACQASLSIANSWSSLRFMSIESVMTSSHLILCHPLLLLPGASVRNSAHGKGHEEGGLAYTKEWSSLRKPPVPEHLPPKPEYVLCSHLHLWLYGGVFPHHHFSRRRSQPATPGQ